LDNKLLCNKDKHSRKKQAEKFFMFKKNPDSFFVFFQTRKLKSNQGSKMFKKSPKFPIKKALTNS